ncbi:MAG: hypothetical protein CSB15_01460 [Clostridiales bacterium]|nr:MAG: hypothetical protein CSB15_01460 [Clostridiales bacterium]
MNKDVEPILTSEMPIEKLFSYGAENLSNSELLAILLKTGNKKLDVLSLSRKILRDFGSIKNLYNADIEELLNYNGIGAKKIATIKASFELANRLNTYNLKEKCVFNTPENIFNYVKNNVKFSCKEYFLVIALNSKLEEIATEIISVGTQTRTLVNPREVYSFALKKSAHRIVVCHNHPSGHLKPSDLDLEITKRLVDAGKTIGIELIDHIIISNNSYYSLKYNGKM